MVVAVGVVIVTTEAEVHFITPLNILAAGIVPVESKGAGVVMFFITLAGIVTVPVRVGLAAVASRLACPVREPTNVVAVSVVNLL
jgi:hypothetical protein